MQSASQPVKLVFHRYRYFPYERELARLEAQTLGGGQVADHQDHLSLTAKGDVSRLRWLTYVAEVKAPKSDFPTRQHQLEESHRENAGSGKRQVTRYSVHGLHEYKGRFNPQIARFLLNYLGTRTGSSVLDPFCGSGTTLVEASLRGITARGMDLNPLAVFLSNAKLKALNVPASLIESTADECTRRALEGRSPTAESEFQKARIEYLSKWFTLETLARLEALKLSICTFGGAVSSILLALASDLLREYSLQEPSDLRIRRRISPLPTRAFYEAFAARVSDFARNLRAAQNVTGLLATDSAAQVGDSRLAKDELSSAGLFDLVITSPPYATALPYIDTQRLSLVWLELCSAKDIRALEGHVVGSRELTRSEVNWIHRLRENADGLPNEVAQFCQSLQEALIPSDGFRRQAAPSVIYRYFADMQKVFSAMRPVLRKGAKLAFVVGANHTTLGGKKFAINTPDALARIAENLSYRVQEVIPLQTYQRYGLHQKNSTTIENITILESL